MDENKVVINHRMAVDFFPVEKAPYEHRYPDSNKRNLTEALHSVHVTAPDYLLHDVLSRCHVNRPKRWNSNDCLGRAFGREGPRTCDNCIRRLCETSNSLSLTMGPILADGR